MDSKLLSSPKQTELGREHELARSVFGLLILLREVQKLTTVQELELLLLEHGEEVIDMLGQQVDRIEKNIKVKQLVSSVSVPGYLTPVLV